MNRESSALAARRARALRVLGCCMAGSASLIALAAATSASAQEATSPAPSRPSQVVPSAGGDSARVQEVVVTADRRSTSLQRTSISIAAVSGAALQEKQIVTINDLQTQVPGLSVTNSGLITNVNIRGLGNGSNSPNITTGVAVLRDGLYEPEAILLSEPFYDIADVEVLRGPQGTIIGQNSTGGAIQITSNNPNFRGINGYVEGVGGDYSDRRLDGAVNLPLIQDVLAARVAFNIEDRDSFYKDLGQQLNNSGEPSDHPGKVDEHNVRLGLLWRPNQAFQALFKAEINYLDTGGYLGEPLAPPTCSIAGSGCSLASSYYQYGYSGPSAYNAGRGQNPYNLYYNHSEEDIERADRYSLDLKYTLANGITFRSLTGYQHLEDQIRQDVDKAYTPPGTALVGQYTYHEIGPRDDYYSQEVDVISPTGGRFTWLAGGSYFYRTTPVNLTQYPDIAGVTPNPQNIGADEIVGQRTIQRLGGVFGQVTYKIIPTVEIQAGVRYSFDSNLGGGSVQPPASTTTILNRVLSLDGKYSQNVPTGKIAVNWTPIPGQFFYAFYARGYKEGGTNGTNPVDFQPEYVDDYEAGWKGRLFDGHLQTQLGGYYMNYDGLQYQIIYQPTGQNNIVNLTSSTIYGVEASAQAKFDALSVDASFNYNHSELGATSAIASYELPGQGSSSLGPQCASGQTAKCFDYNPYLVSLAGEENPYSPELNASITVSYALPLGPGVLTPRATFSYIGQQYASIFQNSNFYLLDVRHLIDAAVTYKVGPWDAEVFVRNLTDQTYLAAISSTNEGVYGDPRTFGVRVSRSF